MIQCQACGHANPETNKFCGECAAPLVQAELRSEVRKTVTIVFCDVVGSTAMGEALDPESLRHVMERFFAAMQARDRTPRRHRREVHRRCGHGGLRGSSGP